MNGMMPLIVPERVKVIFEIMYCDLVDGTRTPAALDEAISLLRRMQ